MTARPDAATYFGDRTALYDGRYEADSADGHALRARMAVVLRLLGDGPGELLDAGMGPGRLCAELEQRGWTVTGVDASEEMVAAARARLPAGATGCCRRRSRRCRSTPRASTPSPPPACSSTPSSSTLSTSSSASCAPAACSSSAIRTRTRLRDLEVAGVLPGDSSAEAARSPSAALAAQRRPDDRARSVRSPAPPPWARGRVRRAHELPRAAYPSRCGSPEALRPSRRNAGRKRAAGGAAAGDTGRLRRAEA